MANKVFIDTDVIIDHLTDRQPFSNYSSLIFELQARKKISVYISALSVNNVYYISRKLIGHKAALKLIASLIDNINVVGTTKAEVKNALKVGFRDFEDSIQYATALKIKGLDAIITRNIKDFRKSQVTVFSPEVFIKLQLAKK